MTQSTDGGGTLVASYSPTSAISGVTDYDHFSSIAEAWPGRSHLLARLEQVRSASAQHGVTVELLLVGGTFLDLSDPNPEVRCVMFYRQRSSDERIDAAELALLQRRASSACVDVRFVPLDSDPMIPIRCASDFALRCAQEARGQASRPARELVFLDCRPEEMHPGLPNWWLNGWVRRPRRLDEARIKRVVGTLRRLGARTVLDCGCGEGMLLRALLEHSSFTHIVGIDMDPTVLASAGTQLQLEAMPSSQRRRIELVHGSLTEAHDCLNGFDAAAVVEVIEHMDPGLLPAFEEMLFGHARPDAVLVTTPNREYNSLFPNLAGGLRHPDHRFEWSRAEFRDWAQRVANTHAYHVIFEGIGRSDRARGTPTQMAIFTRIQLARQ